MLLSAQTANVEKIQTVLFSDEESAQLPAALAAQLSTTREQVADLLKEATSSADPVAVLCVPIIVHLRSLTCHRHQAERERAGAGQEGGQWGTRCADAHREHCTAERSGETLC